MAKILRVVGTPISADNRFSSISSKSISSSSSSPSKASFKSSTKISLVFFKPNLNLLKSPCPFFVEVSCSSFLGFCLLDKVLLFLFLKNLLLNQTKQFGLAGTNALNIHCGKSSLRYKVGQKIFSDNLVRQTFV